MVDERGATSSSRATSDSAHSDAPSRTSSTASRENFEVSETMHKAQLVLRRTVIVLTLLVAALVCLVLVIFYAVLVLPAQRARKWYSTSKDEKLTNDWWGLHAGDDDTARAKRRPRDIDMRKGTELRHCYITMRDGTKLATDVWIPTKALEEKGRLPVVFHQARYYRSAVLRWPFSLIVNGGKPINFINDPFFKSFLSHGMILVSVDVRGTGASFGQHPGPWSPEEQQDSIEVLDWIDRQSWSIGRVGLWGLSYEGTSAFFTSLKRHPSVVCCCPMFFFWDVYDDISHPGGVPMRHFPSQWQGFNDSLDSGWVQSTGWMARIFLEGVTPVNPEDPWGYQANQALVDHRENWSLLDDAHIRYMDDVSVRTGRPVISACASQALHKLLVVHGLTQGSPSPGSGKQAEELAAPMRSLGVRDNAQEVGGSEGREVEGAQEADEADAGLKARKAEGRDGREDMSLEQSLPHYLHVSGWLDASAHAAVMSFATVPCRGSELLIGPWNHGGHQHVRPHDSTSMSRFDFRTEVSGFLLRHLLADVDYTIAGVSANGKEADASEKKDPPSTSPPSPTPRCGQEPSSAAVRTTQNLDTESSTTSKIQVEGQAVQEVGQAKGEDGSGRSTSTQLDLSRAVVRPLVDAVQAPSPSRVADTVGEDKGPAKLEAPTTNATLEGQEGSTPWTGSRPRVRFYTHQEERWHEASTFPCNPSQKADIILSLGKQKPLRPRPVHMPRGSTVGHLSLPAALPAGIIGSRSGIEAAVKPTSDPTVPFFVPEGVSSRTLNGQSVEDRTRRGSDVGPHHKLDDNIWKGNMAGGLAVDAADATHTMSRENAALAAKGSASPEEASASHATDVPQRSGASRMKDKLSSTLANWPVFRKRKLALSQDSHEEEDCHELVVDVLNDHDGEGVSRWVAMTEFLNLISYKMDGMRSNHLRFTSPPLKQDMEVTGYPVVSLWVSVTDDLPNLDVFAYLQAVRPRTGRSIYVTEGCFRAEHRQEAKRRREVEVRALPGVPIHSYLRADAQPTEKGVPVELKFKLMPTSFRFLKGQRVRLSIGGADARHFHPITQHYPGAIDEQASATASLKDASDGTLLEGKEAESVAGASVMRRVLRVHTGGRYGSNLSLPVPRSEDVRGPGDGDRDGNDNLGGARNNIATPINESFARAIWSRRARSLSSPTILATVANEGSDSGPLREGRWSLKRLPVRGSSEVRSQDAGTGIRDESRIFMT